MRPLGSMSRLHVRILRSAMCCLLSALDVVGAVQPRRRSGDVAGQPEPTPAIHSHAHAHAFAYARVDGGL